MSADTWRYSINYGPDGEENYANVYAPDGSLVGNLRTHHAMAIVRACNSHDDMLAALIDVADRFEGALEAVHASRTDRLVLKRARAAISKAESR